MGYEPEPEPPRVKVAEDTVLVPPPRVNTHSKYGVFCASHCEVSSVPLVVPWPVQLTAPSAEADDKPKAETVRTVAVKVAINVFVRSCFFLTIPLCSLYTDALNILPSSPLC